MVEKPKRNYDPEQLPDKAKKWLHEHRKKVWRDGLADPDVGEIFRELKRTKPRFSNDETFSLREFRDSHSFAYPNQSIGLLDIDDEMFLTLLNNDIYIITDLENRLKTGELDTINSHQIDGAKHIRSLEEIRQALLKYRLT